MNTTANSTHSSVGPTADFLDLLGGVLTRSEHTSNCDQLETVCICPTSHPGSVANSKHLVPLDKVIVPRSCFARSSRLNRTEEDTISQQLL